MGEETKPKFLPMPPIIGYDDFGLITRHDETGKYYAEIDHDGNFLYEARQVRSDEVELLRTNETQ